MAGTYRGPPVFCLSSALMIKVCGQPANHCRGFPLLHGQVSEVYMRETESQILQTMMRRKTMKKKKRRRRRQ